MDWALVELDQDIPPNAIFRLTSDEDLLWPPGGEEAKSEESNLVQKCISVQEMIRALLKRARVECLVATSSGVVPGYVAAGTATLMLDQRLFSVFRIYTSKPLGKSPARCNFSCISFP